MFSYLKPADKVIEGLEQHETVFAKDQPQYLPLHCLVANERETRVMSRWTFTPEQRKAIADGADLYLTLMTFGGPLQPITIMIADKTNADYFRCDFGLPEAQPAAALLPEKAG